MKKKFEFLFFVLSVLILFTANTSCRSEKLDIDDPEKEEEQGIPSFQTIDIVYPYETYVGSVSPELRETLGLTIYNASGAINENTKLIILGSLTEVDQKALETAYINGATIAVENPKAIDFEAFFSQRPDWEGYVSGTPMDDASLYSFDKDDCVSIVKKPSGIDYSKINYDDGIEVEELDANLLNGEEIIPEFEDPTPEYYSYIRSWLKHLIEDVNNDLDGSSASEFENFSSAQHLNASVDFTLDPVVRKIASSKPDEIKGASVKVDINLSVHQIHVYEGPEGEGNYYIVYSDTEFNSENAYKGIFSHWHGGVHVRGIGFYAKELKVTFQLLDSLMNPAKVAFPAVCPPEPDNVNNSVSYSKTASFNIGGSLSISNGYSKDGPSEEHKKEVSAGWSWSKEVSANIANVAVLKTLSGNVAGWKLEFNNTPYYDSKSNKYWINEGENTNARSSQTLRSTWVWYEKDGKDDNNQPPYKIKVHVEGEYEAASFHSSKLDWKTVRKPLQSMDSVTGKVVPGKDIIIPFRKKLETSSVGKIILNNNFKDKYINKILVWEKKTPPNKYEYNKTASYAPKSNIDLGYFFAKDKIYYLGFFAKEEDSSTEEYYEYYLSGSDSIILEKGKDRVINAPNDFRLKK